MWADCNVEIHRSISKAKPQAMIVRFLLELLSAVEGGDVEPMPKMTKAEGYRTSRPSPRSPLPIVNRGYPSSVIFRSSLGLILLVRHRRINYTETLSRQCLNPSVSQMPQPLVRLQMTASSITLCIRYLNRCVSARAVALLNLDAWCLCVSSYFLF